MANPPGPLDGRPPPPPNEPFVRIGGVPRRLSPEILVLFRPVQEQMEQMRLDILQRARKRDECELIRQRIEELTNLISDRPDQQDAQAQLLLAERAQKTESLQQLEHEQHLLTERISQRNLQMREQHLNQIAQQLLEEQRRGHN